MTVHEGAKPFVKESCLHAFGNAVALVAGNKARFQVVDRAPATPMRTERGHGSHPVPTKKYRGYARCGLLDGMGIKRRQRKLKPIVVGLSAGGLSVQTQLVPTDASHCQTLVDLIDSKDVFTAPIASEVGDDVVASVKEVRSMAVSTQSLLESLEGSEEARCIANACKTLMRDYRPGMDQLVLDTALQALRAEVGGSIAVLVRLFNLRPPVAFNVAPYDGRALQILESWLDRR